jgi:hypothetical protein
LYIQFEKEWKRVEDELDMIIRAVEPELLLFIREDTLRFLMCGCGG